MLRKLSDKNNFKIDVNQVKNITHIVFYGGIDQQRLKYSCDTVKIIQSSLSKKLSSERYNGIINLFYIIFNLNATSEEIESALVRITHIVRSNSRCI